MSSWKALLIVFVVANLCTFTLGQECVEPCALATSTCNYVNYPVYPIGLDVSANDAKVDNVKNQPLLAAASQECITAINEYVCAFYYPSCTNTTVNTTLPDANTTSYEIVPTKIKPCMSQCTYLRETACASAQQYFQFLDASFQDLINCSRLDTDGTQFFYNDTSDTQASSNGTCYTLYSVTPIDRCTNETIPSNNQTYARGACQAYNPTLASNSSAVCAPFVSKQIFVLGNLSSYQDLADKNISEVTTLLKRVYPMLTPGCYKRAMSLVCQTAFPTCVSVYDDATGTSYPAPSTPCLQNCESALGDCSYILSMMGPEYLALLNCTTSTSSDGTIRLPAGPTYEFQATTTSVVDVPCADSVFPSDPYEAWVLPDFERCPVIMGRKPNPKDTDMQCWVPCPDPTYTSDEWDALITVYEVVASFSFVLMLFMLVTSLLEAKRRRFRLHMPIYFSGMMMAVAFFVAGSNPKEQTWCDDPVTYATGSTNTRCAVQGFFFQFFGLSSILWWVVIGYHMFSSVFLNHSPDLKHKEVIYHIFAWGIPLVLSIITASIDGHGFAPPAPWCYIHDPGYANDYSQNFHQIAGIAIDYYVFYIPIGLSLLATVIFLTLVFYTVFKVLRTAKSLRKAGNDARVQFRIIFFMLVLLVIFVLIFEWRFGLEALDTDQLKAEDLAWAICKIKIDLGFSTDLGECPEDFFPRRIDYNYTAFETSLAASFGFFIFVTFGTDRSIYEFWGKLLKFRSWTGLKTFIISGVEITDATGSTLPHSSSKRSNSSKESSSAKESESRTDMDDHLVSATATLSDVELVDRDSSNIDSNV